MLRGRGRAVTYPLASAALVVAVAAPAARLSSAQGVADARRAVEEFVARVGNGSVTDLAIRQTLTLYHPDGRHLKSTGDQQLFIKPPRYRRLEQTIDGQREVQLVVAERAWVWREGKVTEAAAVERDRTRLVTPFVRNADDLVAGWKALGVRTEVSHRTFYRRRPVTIIGAGPDDRDVPAVWLDPEYGVVRVVTREKLGAHQVALDLTLSEHRPLGDGVFFPFREELFADGRLLFVVDVKSLDVNRGLSEELFDVDALRRLR